MANIVRKEIQKDFMQILERNVLSHGKTGEYNPNYPYFIIRFKKTRLELFVNISANSIVDIRIYENNAVLSDDLITYLLDKGFLYKRFRTECHYVHKYSPHVDYSNVEQIANEVAEFICGELMEVLIRFNNDIINGHVDAEEERLEKNECDVSEELNADICITNSQDFKVGLVLESGDYDFLNVKPQILEEKLTVVVFPELASEYVEFFKTKNLNYDCEEIKKKVLADSEELKTAIVVCGELKKGRNKIIASFYGNFYAKEDETRFLYHIKSSATPTSALMYDDINNYEIVKLNGKKIGLTICNDCDNLVFSYAYGKVDMILNSTGGMVNPYKWYIRNKARSIENKCFSFVTMGDMNDVNGHIPGCQDYTKKADYVYGFAPDGKMLKPNNESVLFNGGLYVYDINSPQYLLEPNQETMTSKAVDTFKSCKNGATINIDELSNLGIKNLVVKVLKNKEIFNPRNIASIFDDWQPGKKYILISEQENDFDSDKVSTLLIANAKGLKITTILKTSSKVVVYSPYNREKDVRRNEFDGPVIKVDLDNSTGILGQSDYKEDVIIRNYLNLK